MTVPRPETLVEYTVKAVREQIADGRFGDVLPGEPRLASHLHVSRGTLRKALSVLANQGVISESRPGSPRRVRGRFSAAAGQRRTYRVGVLAPRTVDALSIATQHFLRELAAETEADGIEYSYHHSVATQRKRPARRLRTLFAENPSDLWLLYEAPIPVARFFKSSGTPAIICGGPSLDEGVSYCGFDGAAVLRHAIGVFVRAGHTRIILPSRYRRRIREQAFREEFEKRGIPFQPSVHMPLWNSDVDQLRRLLCRRLDSPDRPTACILNTLEALIVLYSCLMERRLTVPNDLSVLTFGSDPMLRCFCPAICYYQTPYRALALAMADMIRSHLQSPNRAPTVKLLLSEYVHGGSVGPVPHAG